MVSTTCTSTISKSKYKYGFHNFQVQVWFPQLAQVCSKRAPGQTAPVVLKGTWEVVKMMQGVAFSEVNGNNLAAPSVKYMATLRLFLWRYKGKVQLRKETFLHFLGAGLDLA